MIEREITPRLTALFRQYPFVTVTGPRQSGKTTLCRAAFPDLEYANLEAPDERDFAESDPRGFLARFRDGAVLDEIQRVPELLSYLQVLADERGGNGLFVLTGSEQFRLSDAINQSLAGRTALLRLLPFSMTERQRAGAPGAVDEILYCGFYPRIIDQHLNPTQALADYFETYVERDVRRFGRNSQPVEFPALCPAMCGPDRSADQSQFPGRRRRRVSHDGARMADRSGGQLHSVPAAAVLRQHQQAPGQIAQAVFLRYGSGRVPDRHREPGAGVDASPARRIVRKCRRRGGTQTPFQPRTASQSQLFSRFEGAGMRPLVSCRWGNRGFRDQIRGDHQLGALSVAASGCRTGAGRHVENRGVRRRSPAVQERQPGDTPGRFAGNPEDARRQHGNCRLCRRKQGSGCDDADLQALDWAFSRHIRPVLDGLEPTLGPLASALFRRYSQASFVRLDNAESSSSGLLEARHWETTKAEHLSSRRASG